MNIQSRSESYAAAGVDITAGYKAVELMKSHIARTMTSGVCSDVGGFGGLFELDTTYAQSQAAARSPLPRQNRQRADTSQVRSALRPSRPKAP